MISDLEICLFQFSTFRKMKLFVVFGGRTSSVDLNAEWTLGDLKEELQESLGVDVSRQRLIRKGHTLTDDSALLSSFGVHDGDRIMLLGSSAAAAESPAVDPEMAQLNEIETKVLGDLTGRLGEVESELGGIEGGFLPVSLRQSSLKELAKKLMRIADCGVRALERLDSVVVDAEMPSMKATQIRTRRKTLVDSAHSILERHDSLFARVNGLIGNSGETAAEVD